MLELMPKVHDFHFFKHKQGMISKLMVSPAKEHRKKMHTLMCSFKIAVSGINIKNAGL